MALPTTEKTLPFGGEVWLILQLITSKFTVNIHGKYTPLFIVSLVVTIEK